MIRDPGYHCKPYCGYKVPLQLNSNSKGTPCAATVPGVYSTYNRLLSSAHQQVVSGALALLRPRLAHVISDGDSDREYEFILLLLIQYEVVYVQLGTIVTQ